MLGQRPPTLGAQGAAPAATQAPARYAAPQGAPGRFAGLKNASATSRGNRLQPGLYKVRVTRAEWQKVRNPPNSYAYNLDFVVEEARGDGTNEVGTTATWHKSVANAEQDFGILKSFAAEITGSDPKSQEFIDEVEDFLEATTDRDKDGNPQVSIIAGWLLPVEVTAARTKPTPTAPQGFPFMMHRFGKRIEEKEVRQG